MFDVSFGELMLIGIVALIVIGPERLPKVARTVGHLLGRAQRYVNEVKADIQKEVDLEEITSLKHQMEDAAQSVKTTVAGSMDTLKDAVNEPAQALEEGLDEARKALGKAPTKADTETPATPSIGAGDAKAPATGIADGAVEAPATPSIGAAATASSAALEKPAAANRDASAVETPETPSTAAPVSGNLEATHAPKTVASADTPAAKTTGVENATKDPAAADAVSPTGH